MGGTVVTIVGRGLVRSGNIGALQILFDGVPGIVNSSWTTDSDGNQVITVTTPAHIAGVVDIEFIGDFGTHTEADSYTYQDHFINISGADDIMIILDYQAASQDFDGADVAVVDVTTNNSDGYTLTMRSDDSTRSNNLVCESSSSDSFGPTANSPGVLSNNSWGYQMGSSPSSSAWRPVPTTNISPVLVNSGQATGPSQDGQDSDSTSISFGARATLQQKPCIYWGTVTFTAVVNI